MYEKLYHMLFNAMTDALTCIQQQNYGSAKDILCNAQIAAEALYLSETEAPAGQPTV